MKKQLRFDYAIIGSGLAGLQLALSLSENTFFNNKQIAVIDKQKKNTNDKTWSFWEKGNGKWDDIVSKSWQKAHFFSSKEALNLELSPYSYKTIKAIDFYTEVITKLKQKVNIHFITEDVIQTTETDHVLIQTNENTYTAHHVFDSRIPSGFNSEKDSSTKIIQHFTGWVIETETPAFNPEAFTMMDFRLKDGNQTVFTYVLPFSKTKALIEFTYFTKETVNETTYSSFLTNYIQDLLKIEHYKIIETEHGEIPMTTFPFENYSTKHITKIGTAGGWVKGSTGYSFKHTEKKVAQIIRNLQTNKRPSSKLTNKIYKFYDAIFLKVLHDENDKGKWIFEQFYSKNSIETMFRFLDEESTFTEDAKIISSLFSSAFIKAFFKHLFGIK